MLRRRRNGWAEEDVQVAERLRPYLDASSDGYGSSGPEDASEGTSELEYLDEFMERAVQLLTFMPRNQQRETIEDLVAPYDRERGRRAIDALIRAAYLAEDPAGRLRRLR